MQFGKYAIADDVTHYFEKEQDWYWKVKAVTTGMELAMSKFLNHRRLISTPEGRAELPPTSMEIAFREVALTFGGTNIPEDTNNPVEDGGVAFIQDDASVEEIEKKLAQIPRDMFSEIWDAVGEAYPYWGPADPNATAE
jgi:hypothetical protein